MPAGDLATVEGSRARLVSRTAPLAVLGPAGLPSPCLSFRSPCRAGSECHTLRAMPSRAASAAMAGTGRPAGPLPPGPPLCVFADVTCLPLSRPAVMRRSAPFSRSGGADWALSLSGIRSQLSRSPAVSPGWEQERLARETETETGDWTDGLTG